MQCVRGLPQLRKSKSLKENAQHEPEAGSDEIKDWPAVASAYEMLGQAGKGAHAVVYRACCKPLDEIVAVKKLSLDSNSNCWDLTALIREATLMCGLHHPHLLPLHTSFVAGRQLWFVTPFMGLGSVRAVMKQRFPEGLDEVAIATIMRYVLLGLEYVHKNSGIHRDVKADNILLSEDGGVVLADFGVAAARQRDPSLANLDMAAVMATTFVGTPCWMAPEVMEQQDGYDTAADIWSVGITLIELATGRPPLARLHPMRVVLHTLQQPPPCLEDGCGPTGRRFSKVLKEAVEACLQKDPAARPSASGLLSHRFFKTMARDSAWLARHFASQLPAGCAGASTGAAGAAGGAMRGPSMFFRDGMSFAAAAGRLKSAWVFPPQQLQPHQEQQDGCCEEWLQPAASTAAGAAPGKAVQAAVEVAAAAAAEETADGEGRCVVEVLTLPPAGQQKQEKQQEEERQQQQQQQQRGVCHSSRLLRKAASAGAAGTPAAAQQSPGGSGNVVMQIWGGFVRALSRGSSMGSRGRGSWSSSISSGASAAGGGAGAAATAAGAGDATDAAGVAEQAAERGVEEGRNEEQQQQQLEEQGEEDEEEQGPQHQRQQLESFSAFAERPRNLPAWCDGSRH